MPAGRRIEPGRVFSLVLSRARPVRLSAPVPLLFAAGRAVRIVGVASSDSYRFTAQIVEYWYQFATTGEREILAFHWTPEAVQPGEQRYPHLHIGSVMLAERTPVLPGRFNKVHIPTGVVSLAAVVRFGIEELAVRPVRSDWEDVLIELEEGASR